MNLLQEYKELYYKELEYSERLSGKINTCITFLTILGSAQVLLWSQFICFSIEFYTLIYLIFCACSTIVFIICLYKFYKSYSGYKIAYLPIKEMAIAITTTYQMTDEANIEKANVHVNNMLCESFINQAIHNREVNFVKNKNNKSLSSFICIAFVITILSYTFSVGINYYETKYINNNTQNVYIQGGEINVKWWKHYKNDGDK